MTTTQRQPELSADGPHSRPDLAGREGARPSLFKPRWCDECGNKFQPFHASDRFCGKACRMSHNGRKLNVAVELYDAVMRWRIERPKRALFDLTQLADQLATEERLRRTKRKDNIENQRKGN